MHMFAGDLVAYAADLLPENPWTCTKSEHAAPLSTGEVCIGCLIPASTSSVSQLLAHLVTLVSTLTSASNASILTACCGCRQWLRCHMDVKGFYPGQTSLQYIDSNGLTALHFRASFDKAGLPCMLTNLIGHWPGMSQAAWSLMQL